MSVNGMLKYAAFDLARLRTIIINRGSGVDKSSEEQQNVQSEEETNAKASEGFSNIVKPDQLSISKEGMAKNAALDDSQQSSEQQEEVDSLKERDQEVRAHENAHKQAAGPYAQGGIVYEYETGPDGKQYAVGGHVSIDTSKESTPEATMRKAQTIKSASLAPNQPSSADQEVARKADEMMREAQQEMSEAKSAESEPEANAAAGQAQAEQSAAFASGYANTQPEQNAPPMQEANNWAAYTQSAALQEYSKLSSSYAQVNILV